jgi:hypothetical protein
VSRCFCRVQKNEPLSQQCKNVIFSPIYYIALAIKPYRRSKS